MTPPLDAGGPPGTPDADAAARWAGQARAAADRLRRLYQPCEEAFLAVGEDLRRAQSTTRGLAVTAQALAGRLAEPELQETLRSLDDMVALVHALGRRTGGRLDALRGIAARADGIRTALGDLGRTMAQIGVLGIGAKIETAHMAGAGDDFSVFTHGIMHLAGRGRDVAERALLGLAALAASAGEAAALQDAFERTQMAMLATVGTRLGASVRTMRQRERQAAEALAVLPRDLDAAQGRIGRIVGGLQCGDSTRQRLEHVEGALTVLAEALAGGGDDLTAWQRRVFVHAVAELQVRQLAHVRADFDAAVAEVARDLQALGGAVEAIHARTEAVYSEGEDGGSTFLMSVDTDLAKVAEVIDGHIRAVAVTDARLRTVVRTAGELARSMKAIAEIDADLNVIGLNASIKCGSLGLKGRALNVIAQELRALARHTRGLSAAVEAMLEDIRRGGAALAQAGSGVDDLAAMRQPLALSVERLGQAGGETAWVLSHIRDNSRDVVAMIAQSAPRFAVWRDQSGALADIAGALAALAADADPGLPGEALEQARGELLGVLEGHYTMASERAVHRTLLAGCRDRAGPADGAAAAPSGTGGDPLDGIFF